MAQEFDRDAIIENLRLLSEWLSVKYPEGVIELTVVGGAAIIKSMQPTTGEMKKALSFVFNIDNTELRTNDLRILLKEMGFEFDEVAGSNKG